LVEQTTSLVPIKVAATREEEAQDHAFFLRYAVAMAKVAQLKHDAATNVGTVLLDVVTRRGVNAAVPCTDSTPPPPSPLPPTRGETASTEHQHDEHVWCDIEDNILSHVDDGIVKCDELGVAGKM
jgi:hypothetical protein